ncbi:MAG: carbamoyltransferase C-terminal domain-containing protein [Desulfobacterales bacterium]|jgi:carbamoyltransferase
MRILALYFGHDANCTLLEDGEPTVVLEKERLSRIKHDQGYMDLDAILEAYRWNPESIDIIVINPYIRPTLDGEPYEWMLQGDTYQTNPEYEQAGWMGTVDRRYSRHRIMLFDRWYDCYAVDHHLAHVAGALFTSPFEEAGILTADGSGDGRNCALAYGNGNKINNIEYGWGHEGPGRMQLNIGRTWASIGEYNFGMKRLEGAGKLMGLASYGTPCEDIIETLKQQMLYHPFSPFPRDPSGRVNVTELDPKSKFAQDICASLQQLTTDYYIAAAKRMREWQPVRRLIMTGGCSMNCIANTAIHQSGLYDKTWVPAQPHDGGLSLGAALFVWHHILDRPRTPRAWSPYLGTDAGNISEDIIVDIIRFLEDGKSVGLCYGRAESGPRALGHRSILLDPRLSNGKDILNQHVKYREWYRPFAPMTLDNYGVPSKYMSYIVPTNETEVPAITHVDGTSRPQIVEDGDDPFILELLTRWRDKTGCNLILNTSFNCQEPLVDTVAQARSTWKRTGLDVLVSPEGIETEKTTPYELRSNPDQFPAIS